MTSTDLNYTHDLLNHLTQEKASVERMKSAALSLSDGKEFLRLKNLETSLEAQIATATVNSIKLDIQAKETERQTLINKLKVVEKDLHECGKHLEAIKIQEEDARLQYREIQVDQAHLQNAADNYRQEINALKQKLSKYTARGDN